MITNDQEILNFLELQDALDLSGSQLNSLIENGMPSIELGDKRVFLVSSIKNYLSRIEEKKRKPYPEKRELKK